MSSELSAKSPDYRQWLADIKGRYRQVQLKAAMVVNTAVLEFYWDLGADIVTRQSNTAWGQGFLTQLSADLMAEFPGVAGFSKRNLEQMRRWVTFWSRAPQIAKQPASQLMGVAIIRGTDIPDLQSNANSRVPVRYTSQKKLTGRKLEGGDLLLEVSGGSKDQPTGRSLYLSAALLDQFDCPVEPASFCRLLRPVNKEVGMLLAQHLTYIYAQGKTWEYQNQSTGIANFQTTHFLETELVACPSDDVLKAFAETVQPLIARAHLTQIQELVSLRDTLLPRLISGQLQLQEAQHNVEEAL
jgi:DUF1016 N-terminal domain